MTFGENSLVASKLLLNCSLFLLMNSAFERPAGKIIFLLFLIYDLLTFLSCCMVTYLIQMQRPVTSWLKYCKASQFWRASIRYKFGDQNTSELQFVSIFTGAVGSIFKSKVLFSTQEQNFAHTNYNTPENVLLIIPI